jgi:hypothetical protein
MWWFIDDESEYGWIKGKFRDDIVELYCRWLASVIDLPGVDTERVGLFGWSAGAYAVTEVLAHGCIPVSGVGLGAVHGHGQMDQEELPAAMGKQALTKFEAYLERLQNCGGVPWLEATHGNSDKESKFMDALEVFRVLSERQEFWGQPIVSMRELDAEEQDVKPKAKKNRSHHNYFNASFLRKEFLIALFGGEQPEPGKQKEKPEQDDEEEEVADTPSITVAVGSKRKRAPLADWSGPIKPIKPLQAEETEEYDEEYGSAAALYGSAMNMHAMWGFAEALAFGVNGFAEDDVCWDMQNKGFCKRGAQGKCKYCKA